MSGIANKAFLYIAAAAAIAAAVAVVIVSLAYAEFALAHEYFSAAGSAAVVAATVALLLVIGAVALVAKSKRKEHAPEPTLGEKAAEFVKRKPLLAVAAALGGGFLALRNPALVATVVMSFLAPSPPKRR